MFRPVACKSLAWAPEECQRLPVLRFAQSPGSIRPMPHEQMDEKEVAAYLHMDVREVAKLASRGRIPCRKIAGRFCFHKGELDHWVESQMDTLGKERLEGIERGVTRHHGFDAQSMLVCGLIPPAGLAVPLKARTRDAVIRRLVDLADGLDLVYCREELLAEVRAREELCTTAMVPGVALPHPRHPLPHDIAASFIVVGRTSSGICYGAADGSLTRLFFLICCKDDRTHLHVLARLARMIYDPATIEELLQAPGEEPLRSTLQRLEKKAIQEAEG